MNNEILQPYRGTRDFYPDDFHRLNYIFSVWREVCTLYGFDEYLSPLLEYRSLYTAKHASGDEVANQQLYWFTDQGDREVAIRPEMTPSVARMVGARINALPKPVKWFSITNFMRYERPQKGRLREFFQLNLDIFGSKSIEIDAELVEMAIAMMQKFGANESMYTIKINNRQWFNYWLIEIAKVTQNVQAVSRIIDNWEKESVEQNVTKLENVGLNTSQVEAVLALRDFTIEKVSGYSHDAEGARDVVALIDRLSERGMGKYIVYDPLLVRGFDYYTGNVFEQYDKHPENKRSMFGGGRYDGLVELYSGKSVPANGYAPGDVTTAAFLDNWNLWPKFSSDVQVLVTVLGNDTRSGSWEIAQLLRNSEIATELVLNEGEALANQVKYADKKGIRFVVVAGHDEVSRGVVNVKELSSGKQVEVAKVDLVEWIYARKG